MSIEITKTSRRKGIRKPPPVAVPKMGGGLVKTVPAPKYPKGPKLGLEAHVNRLNGITPRLI